MKKTTNTFHYGLSCGLGSFVSGAVAIQLFGNSLLWGTVGAILGIFVGLIVAMFANDSKGFPRAVADSLAGAWKDVSNRDGEIRSRLQAGFKVALSVSVLFGTTMFIVVVILLPIALVVEPDAPLREPTRIFAIFLIAEFLLPAFFGVIAMAISTKVDRDSFVEIVGAVAGVLNLPNIVKVFWKHRGDIFRGIKVFLARMYLYIHANGGTAFLVHISIATGGGLYFGKVFACAVAGFVLGCADRFIHNKSHEHLLALVGKQE